MGTLSSSGKVGALALLAFAVFGGMWLFFSRTGIAAKTYYVDVYFDDASGVVQGVDVLMSGVKIGSVKSVLLDKRIYKADVKLQIERKFPIPVGSHFAIVSALLGGSSVISVTPPVVRAGIQLATLPRGTVVQGDNAPNLNEALEQADQLIAQVTATTKKVDSLIDKTLGVLSDPRFKQTLQHTLSNVDMASTNGLILTRKLNYALDADNAQVKSILAQAQSGSKVAIHNFNDTTTEIRDATHENRAKIDSILANVQDTTSAISGLTAQINSALSDGGISKNLSATVANMKLTTDKLLVITDSLQKLSTDQSMQSDIKKTVHNVEATTAQSALLLERLNELAGSHKKTKTATDHVSTGASADNDPQLPLVLSRVDLQDDLTHKHFRADANAIFPFSGSLNSFADVGIYGVGDESRLNMQYGKRLAPGSPFDYRTGLYSSSLGLGLDYGINGKLGLSVDAYNPNRLHVDAKGVFMMNDAMGLAIGADDITHRKGVFVGLEMRK